MCGFFQECELKKTEISLIILHLPPPEDHPLFPLQSIHILLECRPKLKLHAHQG